MLREISVEILRKCPNNCLHCSSMSDLHCEEILNYNLFTSVVDDAVDIGVETICLSGGEPFLHPDIVKMIEYIFEKGVKCYVYTSGITVDEQGNYLSINNNLLEQIVKKVAKLIFNVEAATSETYDIIMGTKNCFEIMKNSIRNANNLSITTEAHFVPMRINLREVNDTVFLCKELGISKISFLRLVLHGRAQDNESKLSLSDAEFIELQSLLNTLQNNSDIEIRIGVPLSSDSLCHKCEAANGKLNIKYDGNVFPCEVFKNERMAKTLFPLIPDKIHERRLLEIYHESQYLKKVREISEKYSCSGHCETCIGQHLITKGCVGGVEYAK